MTALPPEPPSRGRRRATTGDGDRVAGPSRRTVLGIIGGVVGIGAAGTALAVANPFSSGASSQPGAGARAGAATDGVSPSASGTPRSTAAPTPTATPESTDTPSPTPDAEPSDPASIEAAPAVGAMPTGDVTSYGVRWTPIYSEDFVTPAHTGQVLARYPAMSAYASGKDTSGYGEYAPDQVLSVHDSVLDYHLHVVDGQPLSASVLPDDYAPHQYARVSIRYRASSMSGYKFVGILWPSSNNWDDGEIDWPEGDLDSRARPASEVVGGKKPDGTRTFVPGGTQYFADTDQTDFHVATTEWSAGIVRFFWDGKPLAVVEQGVPTKPMRVTLQAETWINDGPPPSSADGHVEIDWVVIYREA